MCSQSIQLKVVLGLALLLGLSSGSSDGQTVVRPEDPATFLNSPDANRLKGTHARVVERMGNAVDRKIVFSSKSDYSDFVNLTREEISKAVSGRTQTTIELGNATLGALSQIESYADDVPMPSVDVAKFEELAKTTAELMASVVSEGMKGMVFASPQAPSKVLPSAQGR